MLQVNGLENVDEMVEKLMELPRALQKQTQMNTTMIAELINQQERLLKVICGLHDIDLDVLRKEVQNL